MKNFFLFLLTFTALATTAAEKERIVEYQVFEPVKDQKVPAGQSRVVFRCWSGSSTTLQNQPVLYAIDGKNESDSTDGSGSFAVLTTAGARRFQLYMGSGLYYEITIANLELKSGHRTAVSLYFRRVPENDYLQVEKPVIYLYPETDREVSVELEPAGELQFTYPAYENGWKGVAHPDGSMTIGEKRYPYLFWDATMPAPSTDNGIGWVLRRGQTIGFLEEKLAAIGLTDREQADFITYWGPRLEAESGVFVQFVWGTGATDRFGALNISPQPDQVNRLYILWKPLGVAPVVQPEAQELPVFDRSGFDVLEWGGMELRPDTEL